MIIVDLFFYTIYRFLNKKFRRCKDDAKFSALTFLCVYVSFFIITMIDIAGLIKDNAATQRFANNEYFLWIITGLISYTIFGIRYYWVIDVEQIERKFTQRSNNKRNILKILIYFFLIAIPISFFMGGFLKSLLQ